MNAVTLREGGRGVKSAEPVITAIVQILDRKGKPTVDPSRGFPSIGWNWITDARLNPFTLIEGRAPRGTVRGGDRQGDRPSGQLPRRRSGPGAGGGRHRCTSADRRGHVAGADNLAGSGFALMETDRALRFFATGGRVDYIAVLARPGARMRWSARLNQVLPDEDEAISGGAMSPSDRPMSASNSGSSTRSCRGSRLVALVAGAFLIYNTFGIIVAQRTRELALLRALGASRRQVIGSVLLEAAMVGLFAALIGLARRDRTRIGTSRAVLGVRRPAAVRGCGRASADGRGVAARRNDRDRRIGAPPRMAGSPGPAGRRDARGGDRRVEPLAHPRVRRRRTVGCSARSFSCGARSDRTGRGCWSVPDSCSWPSWSWAR